MLTVVTGGTGFLGSHLVRLLQEREMRVRVLLRPGTSPAAVPAGIETRFGDVRDVAALREAFAGASTVFMVGNGRNTLDLSYARNIAHALWLAAARPEAVGRIYNVADGFGITCTQYLAALATALGLPVPKRRIPRALVQPLMALLLPPEPEPKGTNRPTQGALLRLCALFRDSEPDISRIRKELGYAPPVDFTTGVNETVGWHRTAFPAR